MIAVQFLELFCSVSMQAMLVVSIAYWLGRFIEDDKIRCHLWTVCFVTLLLSVLTAAILPHRRFYFPGEQLAHPIKVEMISLQLQFGRMLFWVWLAGCLVSLGLFIRRSIQAEAFLRECRFVDPDVVSLKRLIGSEQHSGVDRKEVCLVSTADIVSPFCWQFHKPYIVIPESLLLYDENELKFILKHELAHLQTGHPLQVFLQRIVEIIFWFHPMVWWASRSSALAREFMCDDQAVESKSDIVCYLKALLRIAEETTRADQPQRSLSFVRNRCEMAERARRLVRVAQSASDQKNTKRHFRSTLSSLSFMAIACLTISFVWLPVNAIATSDSPWSPWPRWSAKVLNDFGYKARDFERDEHQYTLHELFEEDDDLLPRSNAAFSVSIKQ